MPLTALGGVLAVQSLAAVNGGMTRLDKSTTKGSVVTEQLQLLLRPEDFAISPEGLFSAGADAWRAYASDEGYLRIRPALHEGAVGLQGTLALGIPPSVEEVDAWEASRPAGCWDYYGFLNLVTVPTDSEDFFEVVLFIHPGNLFEAPIGVVSRFRMSTTEDDRCPYEDEDDDEIRLRKKWDRLQDAIARHCGTADLEAQRWTVGSTVFDASAPDA